ncbi:MAG: protein-L-isoaspartate O-methyltransferase family protein [Nanobdellota archaeon]
MAKAELLETVRLNLAHFAKTSEDRVLIDRIIKAMDQIDRKYFVSEPYIDTALPIGHNQTISQPSTVGRMLMLAELKPGDDVLELGTGSGWNAALIAYLVHPGTVVSLDLIPELVRQAKDNVETVRRFTGLPENLELRTENIFKRPHTKAYDKIIITAGIQPHEKGHIRTLAADNLKEDGILVCPHTQGPMLIYRKQDAKIKEEHTTEQYVFVSLNRR